MAAARIQQLVLRPRDNSSAKSYEHCKHVDVAAADAAAAPAAAVVAAANVAAAAAAAMLAAENES